MKKVVYKFTILVLISLISVGCQNPANIAIDSKQENSETISKPESAKQHYESSNFRSALLAYNCLIEKDSTFGEYFFNRGICHMELHDFNQAIKDFTAALQLNYRVADANFNISISYISQANDSLALIYMKEYSRLKPNDNHAKKLIRDFVELGQYRNNSK